MIARNPIIKLCFLSLCVGDAAFAPDNAGKSLDAKSRKDAGATERPGPHKIQSTNATTNPIGLPTPTSKANKFPPKEDDLRIFMLLREERASYSDGLSAMDFDRPNARDISNAFGNVPSSMPNSLGATDMLWAFGQFVNHDISEVLSNDRDPCHIPVPLNDPFLDGNVKSIPMNRSNSVPDSITGISQQISMISPFVDAENVYGNTLSRLQFIRADDSSVTGRLRTSGPNLLPKNTNGLSNRGGDASSDLFLAGDIRANENLALTVSHTLWIREHNYWADKLRVAHPELSGDDIFKKTKVIIQAEMQKVIYDEFLPALLGDDAIPPYNGFKLDVDPRLENVVSSCAFRIGHSMVGPALLVDYGNRTIGGLSLEDSFFAPSQLERTGGIDAFLRGMVNNVCQEVDPFIVPAMRNHLFNNQFDLLAINIERARDHGIPDFNSIRASLGFEKLDNFDDFLFSQELASVYSDTDQIDCWIGMNSEPRLEGLMLGETQRVVLARNFANIRDGDVNFYKNSITDPELLALIEGTTLADVIRRNSDNPGSLDDVRDEIFILRNKDSLFS
ncbi:hypothetical protein HJC23_002921 [Cyclotella cryptica]|uniref:Peroxidase n=1 Tax=Cyclotella cryptica TaxID=29204 RepID=A0ABD3PQC3_9STRA|eukprot:CCRYP_012437-RA/>CCRYP_012437-RA protein AED:0.04 eAED:0.04 QI:227/1/1/1/1/1/3/114/561